MIQIKSAQETVVIQDASDEAKEPDARLVASYGVWAEIDQHGHVCTRLVRVDLSSARVVAVKLGCYHVPVASEGAALDAIVTSALDRRADLSRESE